MTQDISPIPNFGGHIAVFQSTLFVKLRLAVQSFWFLPSLMGVAGLLLAAITLWIDGRLQTFPFLQSMGPVTTRSMLQTIATASITVISLTYSLTLVVFTLAAGNIAPRLLARFRESPLTRISIGVFCATFLFSITILNFVGDARTPKISALTAFALAIVSVYVLIVYVHHVSSQVLVDNEVAQSVSRADAAIRRLIEENGEQNGRTAPELPRRKPEWQVCATMSGYVRSVQAGAIVEAARRHDVFVDLKVAPGDFVIQDLPVATVMGLKSRELSDAIVRDGLVIGPTRSPDDDAGFLIHLVIEIAIRALSPGVNDTYTAVSCVDNLSAVLCTLLKGEPPAATHCDPDGVPRLHYEQISVPDILEKALRPLRISARGNLVVTLRLMQALQHMAVLSRSGYRNLIRFHADMIMADASDAMPNAHDLAEVRQMHDEIIATLGRTAPRESRAELAHG